MSEALPNISDIKLIRTEFLSLAETFISSSFRVVNFLHAHWSKSVYVWPIGFLEFILSCRMNDRGTWGQVP